MSKAFPLYWQSPWVAWGWWAETHDLINLRLSDSTTNSSFIPSLAALDIFAWNVPCPCSRHASLDPGKHDFFPVSQQGLLPMGCQYHFSLSVCVSILHPLMKHFLSNFDQLRQIYSCNLTNFCSLLWIFGATWQGMDQWKRRFSWFGSGLEDWETMDWESGFFFVFVFLQQEGGRSPAESNSHMRTLSPVVSCLLECLGKLLEEGMHLSRERCAISCFWMVYALSWSEKLGGRRDRAAYRMNELRDLGWGKQKVRITCSFLKWRS